MECPKSMHIGNPRSVLLLCTSRRLQAPCCFLPAPSCSPTCWHSSLEGTRTSTWKRALVSGAVTIRCRAGSR
jgi:hypothetical protein